METAFTPLASLGGGALIGLASVVLMAVAGRIMGATGILAGALLTRRPGDTDWRLVLLLGMVSAPPLLWLITGEMLTIDVPVSTLSLLIGGLLVGMGVSFGGGCTSGHGVCGLARFSKRSVVATLTFMVATFATVFVTRHVLGG